MLPVGVAVSNDGVGACCCCCGIIFVTVFVVAGDLLRAKGFVPVLWGAKAEAAGGGGGGEKNGEFCCSSCCWV